MITKWFYLFAVIVFLANCTSAPEKKKGKAGYPSAKYLTVEGTGQSESEARNQAVAEMSRVFRSQVYSDTVDRVKAVVDKTGSELSEQSVESNVRVVTGMELKGVRVEETWYDEPTAVFHAVAVLDRSQARDSWLGEIRDLDSSIEGELRALGDTTSMFAKFLALQRVVRIWIEREVLVSYVRVLGFDAKAPTSYQISSVFQMLPEVRADMVFFVEITGDHADVIENVISESLGKAGLMTGKTPEKADVIMRGTVDVSPVDLDNPGWEFVRAQVSLSVIDARTGLHVRELTFNKRAGHITYEEAVNKALKEVAAPVRDEIMSLL